MTSTYDEAENSTERRKTRSTRANYVPSMSATALWTEEETRALVGVWGAEDVQSQRDMVERNKAIFEQMTSSLANHGYHRTWQQCKTKIKNMTSTLYKLFY